MEANSYTDDAAIEGIARRHGFSVDAARTMFDAVVRGNGSMAQFSHPEFGGAGQWMRGGMTMVADLFNNRLKAAIDGLCVDLANLAASRSEPAHGAATSFQSQSQSRSQGGTRQALDSYSAGGRYATASGTWWPGELGRPNASGSQNGARYAYFAGPRRLAIESDGQLTVYDTHDHQISGVAQQQSSDSRLSFSSQHGPVDVARLTVVSGTAGIPVDRSPAVRPDTSAPVQAAGTDRSVDVPALIEKLAALHANGVLSDDEFRSKKAELLARI